VVINDQKRYQKLLYLEKNFKIYVNFSIPALNEELDTIKTRLITLYLDQTYCFLTNTVFVKKQKKISNSDILLRINNLLDISQLTTEKLLSLLFPQRGVYPKSLTESAHYSYTNPLR
jgi:hypothetical protein